MVITMKKIKNNLALIAEIQKKLLAIYDDPALCQQYAWWTLQAITNRSQAALVRNPDQPLTEEQENRLFHWLDALINAHMPIQYLIGSVPFANLEILVKEPVLIPRPETEEWTLNLIEQLDPLRDTKLHILDLCTGTGCIALALAKALPEANILTTDISQDALDLAEKNARHNRIDNATFLLSDLFADIPPQQFDLIVCNPPYIAPAEWKTLDRSVTVWEDKKALVAPEEGLALIKKIIQQAPAYMRYNAAMVKHKIPQLLLEIGPTQADAIVTLMQQACYISITVHKDLEKKDRVVSGSINHVATTKTTK